MPDFSPIFDTLKEILSAGAVLLEKLGRFFIALINLVIDLLGKIGGKD
ncbi:MAG: hypothetical protein HYS89_00705 [Candidatus Colwellbacteria bacterium]|nr:hypothetical protein [Candidatus Colwellbacteria bacterium]